MNYSDADILHLRARAFALGMSCPPEFFDWPIDLLKSICNGIGGAGSKFGPILNWLYSHCQAEGAIHDLRYHIGGDQAARKLADDEFLGNLLKGWADRWGLFRWLRPLARAERKQLQAAYVAVRIFGDNYFNFTASTETSD